MDPPTAPTFFAKFANALTGPGATVALPAASDKVDYEAEVAFVIGRRARAVAVEAGARARRRLHAAQRPLGPRPAVPDAAVDPWQGLRRQRPLRALARDPGRGRPRRRNRDRDGPQRRAPAVLGHGDLIFGVAELVSRLSHLMTLEPGDIVSTGTPSGVGSTREPKIWLTDGDECVVSSPQLGELRTPLIR